MRSKRLEETPARGQDGTPHRRPLRAKLRSGRIGDLDALLALECKVFATDRMSRRSARQFLLSPRATVLVAELDGRLRGAAVVLFRHASDIGRLYSIAVDPDVTGNGIGQAMLNAAEETAIARDCQYLRLEVHEKNFRAIDCYRKSGYREFGRHKKYYQDNGDALRFEKQLAAPVASLAKAPPYFHQTTEFTCGPACILMALAWADPKFCPTPATEFRLWREATTIFMSSGPGGCGPFGMAVALKRHGLSPEIFVTHPGPYFLDTVQSLEKRRVMRITQEDFVQEAKALGIAMQLTHADESVLMPALRNGASAIVLLSGYHMKPRGQPHWVFVFGCEGRFVLLHDPAAVRDKHGQAAAPETYAVPWTAFMRMTRCGRDHLGAAILIRKGPRP
ncbi:MAG: peptidase C39 family protein [Xanthobacteraceae bacterium]